MRYRVDWTTRAEADLDRLFDFLIERELAWEDGDLSLPGRAVQAIRAAVAMLERVPFTCRGAGDGSSLRELVIASGSTGYVALFDITADERVVIIAIRHQREEDYSG